MTVFYL